MRKKINCILLIDDDKSTNFLHKIIIEETGVSEKVEAVQSGQEALDYLERTKFINGFLNKPLTTGVIEKIIDDHFQNKE